MVRKVIHTNKILYSLIIAVIAVPLLAAVPLIARGDAASAVDNCSATNSANPCNLTFQVNIKEVLKVSVSAPNTAASGLTGDFLRNKVTLSVTSNNTAGFLSYMTTNSNSTALSGSSDTIPTLTTANVTPGTNGADFPANYWGYSVDDTDTLNTSAKYNGLVDSSSTPITLAGATSTTAGAGTQNIFFGAKADSNKSAGTYSGTVVFTVVSGVSDYSNIPNDNKTDIANNTPSPATTPYTPTNGGTGYRNYGSSNYSGGSTVYSSNAISGTTNTKLSYIYSGNQINAVDPLGVTTTIGEGTPLAIGLAVTAAVAATAGIIFFIVAKRKKDDEEEDEDW